MELSASKLIAKIPAILLIISILSSWLFLPGLNGFPFIAFLILTVGSNSLIYILRQNKTWFDLMLFCGIWVLCLFTIIRANDFLQFFDFMFILFFSSILVRPIHEENGVFNILSMPLLVFKDAITTKNKFPYTFKISAKLKQRNYLHYLPTGIITTFILLVTIPLLSSANPFFNALVQDTLKLINLEWLFKYFFRDSLDVYLLRLILLGLFLFFIPRLLTVSLQDSHGRVTLSWYPINYLIPKFTLAGLLVIFFFTQMQLYFASAETLQSMGYTNSRLTNEVFAQVTIVAFIVIATLRVFQSCTCFPKI